MNVTLKSFNNPFSFFCKPSNKNEVIVIDHSLPPKPINGTHGQYVAVLWNNKWVRGIISVESKFLIWLVDHGKYIRPDDGTVYVELPDEYKKQPSNVFEASIHGVVPCEKVLDYLCEIQNKVCKTWNKGAIEKAQELVNKAAEVYFVPVAIMTTKANDIILGDLYLKMLKGPVVNIIDELKKWPVFLEQNEEAYVNDLSNFYTSRRKHRACLEKPLISDRELPCLTVDSTIEEYKSILKHIPDIVFDGSEDDCSEIGSTVLGEKVKKKTFTLEASEIVHFSDTYVTINGVEYNALQLLLNKIKDLEMCEKYQDCNSVGRALTNRYLYRGLM